MKQESNFDEYNVVVSLEGQYSIWPVYKEVPYGWSIEGKNGIKEDCLNYIKEVWIDMRPKDLKEQDLK